MAAATAQVAFVTIALAVALGAALAAWWRNGGPDD